MKKIKISKLFKEKENDIVRICSVIQSDKEDYKLWFEVDVKYEDYILTEKSDGFLIAILPYAIKKEFDIEIEGSISTRLYYQLTTYLIPMLCKKMNKRTIKINSILDSNTYNIKKAVGTGISCGIDSLYTVKTHMDRKEQEYNLTHLTFFNAGASGEYGGDGARQLFKKRMKFALEFAKENNFEFVYVDSNMNEFLLMNHEKTHTFRSLACVLILQKLFSKYYYSSGLDFDDTRIDEYDTACYDILNMQCLTTEDTIFYSTGMETNRINKVKEVAKYRGSYKYLNVCVKEEYNCCKCEKCKRTILELDSIQQLELYEAVFDIKEIKKNKNEILLFMLKNKNINNPFYKEIYNQYKSIGYKIPLSVRIMSLLPNKEYIKHIIKVFCKEEQIEKLKRYIYKKRENIIDDGWNNKM